MAHTERVVILVDMDCFYCQVEEKLDKNLEGKPIAVVQYNEWKGGGIIAVNYPARDRGVTRYMRGDEAKEKCPEIQLPRVPQVRGKADLTKYRDAGKRVAAVLQTFTTLLERASVDEAYLDITENVQKRIEEGHAEINIESMRNTYVVGCDTKDFLYNICNNREYSECDFKLAVGGLIAEEIRAQVYEKTGYRCSAGIAHNKILAKLVCGLNKPNKQTILPQESIPYLYETMPIRKVSSLGGKFGNALTEELKIVNMGELIKFTEKDLCKRFDEKNAKWLYNIARGIDMEPVTLRLVSKSIGCCKNFPGKNELVTPEIVSHWMNELAQEISERLAKDLEENNRKAKQMVVSFVQEVNGKDVSSSRTHPLNSYDHNKIAQSSFEVIKKHCQKPDGNFRIRFLGLSVGNFEDIRKVREITSFFKAGELNQTYVNNFASTSSNRYKSNKLTSFLQRKENNLTPSSAEEIVDKPEKNVDDTDGNTSMYSATTEEMDEDFENLIYFDDVFPQKCMSPIITSVLKTNESMDLSDSLSEDSISGEMFVPGTETNQNDNSFVKKQSFFSKYFQSNSVNAISRDFNTSKIFLEQEDSDDESPSELPPLTKSNREIITPNFIDDSPQSKMETNYSTIDENLDNLSDVCSECNKKILISEIVSHMDYHFALKMVKDEAHLYKPSENKKISPKTSKLENKQPSSTKSKKKIPEVQTNRISSFWNNQKPSDEPETNDNSELCTECNKRIRFDDIINHMDYHTARKLHVDLNSAPKTVKSTKPVSAHKDKKKNYPTKVKNISSFFKPL